MSLADRLNEDRDLEVKIRVFRRTFDPKFLGLFVEFATHMENLGQKTLIIADTNGQAWRGEDSVDWNGYTSESRHIGIQLTDKRAWFLDTFPLSEELRYRAQKIAITTEGELMPAEHLATGGYILDKEADAEFTGRLWEDVLTYNGDWRSVTEQVSSWGPWRTKSLDEALTRWAKIAYLNGLETVLRPFEDLLLTKLRFATEDHKQQEQHEQKLRDRAKERDDLLESVYDWFKRMGLAIPSDESLKQEVMPGGVHMVSWHLNDVFCIATSSGISASISKTDGVPVNTQEELAAALPLWELHFDDLMPKPLPPAPKEGYKERMRQAKLRGIEAVAAREAARPSPDAIQAFLLLSTINWFLQLRVGMPQNGKIDQKAETKNGFTVARASWTVNDNHFFAIASDVTSVSFYVVTHTDPSTLPVNTAEELSEALAVIEERNRLAKAQIEAQIKAQKAQLEAKAKRENERRYRLPDLKFHPLYGPLLASISDWFERMELPKLKTHKLNVTVGDSSGYDVARAFWCIGDCWFDAVSSMPRQSAIYLRTTDEFVLVGTREELAAALNQHGLQLDGFTA